MRDRTQCTEQNCQTWLFISLFCDVQNWEHLSARATWALHSQGCHWYGNSSSGFCWGDHKCSVLTAVSECSLPASWSMHRAPGMFHLACLVICHWLLPWRMEREAKLEVLRTWSSLPQVKYRTQQHQCVQSSIFCHAQALQFFRLPKASLSLCSCTEEK